MLLEGPAQRWARVSEPSRAGGEIWRCPDLSVLQDPVYGGLLLPSACPVRLLWALGLSSHPTLISLALTTPSMSQE